MATQERIGLPDPKNFTLVPSPAGGPTYGEIIGVDQTQWACVTIDLNMRADRLAAERHRIASRGYQLVTGPVTVTGYAKAEVWVMPRAMFEQRRGLKRQAIRDAIASGQMTEFADGNRGTTSRA